MHAGYRFSTIPAMSEQAANETLPAQAPRAVFGGVLMGLANLVPGISGGTMLLAAGIYPRFIASIAQLTTLRFRLEPLVIVGLVAASAMIAIVLGAGLIGRLVVEQRWIMFSLFIGLTLGGVPVLARMIRPIRGTAVAGIVAGLLVMVAVLVLEASGLAAARGSEGPGFIWLMVGGAAAGSAMILPGISGSYLLLLLGLYLPILEAVSGLREAVSARDAAAIEHSLRTIIPVGIGVVLSIVGVSHVLKLLLTRFERGTLGFLLGLLLGAVLGLWPFRAPAPPIIGEMIRGVPMMSEAQIADVPVRHWRVELFAPTPVQMVSSGLLIVTGFGIAAVVDRFGARRAHHGKKTS